MDDRRSDADVEQQRHADAVEEVADVAGRRAADEEERQARTIGVTPGRASIARNGSPNVPGIWRTSVRESVAVRDGSGRLPRTTTSSGSARCGGFGSPGALRGLALGTAVVRHVARRFRHGRVEANLEANLGGDGPPVPSAGSKRNRNAASRRGPGNGSFAERPSPCARSRPRSRRARASPPHRPSAPSGYATFGSPSSFGGTHGAACGRPCRRRRFALASKASRQHSSRPRAKAAPTAPRAGRTSGPLQAQAFGRSLAYEAAASGPPASRRPSRGSVIA